jgi:hypothetical protein
MSVAGLETASICSASSAELVGTGRGEKVRHQPSQHLGDDPPDEADHRRAEDVRHDIEQLRQHGLHRLEQAAQLVGREDGREEEQDHEPEEHVGDRLAHRLHPRLRRQLLVERGRRQRLVDHRARERREQPGDEQQHRARDQPRQVAENLAHELRERVGDQVEVQRVEHRDQGDQDDDPEDAGRDAGLDVHRLGGALGDARVHLEQAEHAAHRRARDDGDQPPDDQDAQRTEDARQLRAERGLKRACERRQVHDPSPRSS